MAFDNDISTLPEGILRCVQEALLLLRRLVYGTEVVSRIKRFSDTLNIDLNKEGGNRGVRKFTLRNLGAHIIYISTSSLDEKEPIYPGEGFSYNTEHRVCDESIKITFDGAAYAGNTTPFSGKNAIIRFLVDKC